MCFFFPGIHHVVLFHIFWSVLGISHFTSWPLLIKFCLHIPALCPLLTNCNDWCLSPVWIMVSLESPMNSCFPKVSMFFHLVTKDRFYFQFLWLQEFLCSTINRALICIDDTFSDSSSTITQDPTFYLFTCQYHMVIHEMKLKLWSLNYQNLLPTSLETMSSNWKLCIIRKWGHKLTEHLSTLCYTSF